MENLYQEKNPHHKSVCWNCHSEVDDSCQLRCKHCGWVVCPTCGACKGGRFTECDKCFTHEISNIRDLRALDQLQLDLMKQTRKEVK